MIYKLIHCYNKHSELLALIDINAISEITWHEDGTYIYWRKYVQEYDEVTTERAGHIVCDWTKVEELTTDTINYLKDHNTKVISKDTTIYNSSIEVSEQYKVVR